MVVVAMASPELVSDMLAKSQQALAETLAGALQNLQFKRTPTVKLSRFCGHPGKPGDPNLNEWLSNIDTYARQLGLSEKEKVDVAIDHLGGPAREEVLCCPGEERDDISKLASLLTLRFGATESLQSLNATFYARKQLEGETLAEFSRSLIRIFDRMEQVVGSKERPALQLLRQSALREQFVNGVREPATRRELKKLSHDHVGVPFHVFRSIALEFLHDVDFPVPSPYAGEWPDSNVAGVNSVPASFTEPGQTLLMKLVEGQNQLTEAVGRLVQQQLDTNAQLRHLSELIENRKDESGPSYKKGSQNRGAPRCNFCKRVGHTVDKCYQKMYKEKSAPKPSDGPIPSPQVCESEKSGNQIPPP